MGLGNLTTRNYPAVAFITGAGSGIGRETAFAFCSAEQNAKLILVDLSEERLKETKELCKTDPKNIKTFALDITDDEKLIHLIQSIPSMLDFGGRLDYAINCAGVIGDLRSSFTTSDMKIDDITLNINLRAQAICLQEQIKIMECQGSLYPNEEPNGCIVNISSVAGIRGGTAGWAYTASKHAVVGMTKSAAVAHGSKIRVNAICPGATVTNVGDSIKYKIDPKDLGLRPDQLNIPIARVAAPRETANAILFMCSDMASYVQGAILPVDGGWTANK